MKIAGVLVLIAFLLGSCMGSSLSSDPPPEFIEVPKTEIVYREPPPPEQVEVMPEACQEALELADDIVRNAEKIYNSGDEQIAILSDARLYLASGRNTEDIDTRQRMLHGRTVGYLFEIEKLFTLYETAREECSIE